MRYGDGRIRRDGTGWLVDIGVGAERIRRWKRTRAAAEAALAQLRAERVLRAAGRHRAMRPDVTYDEAGDAFVAWARACVDRRRRDRTVESYADEVRWLLAWWGPRRLVDTTPPTVTAYVTACRAAGLSTSSIRHRLDRLAQIHTYAVREAGWLAAVPCAVRRPAPDGRARDAATDAEFAALLAAAGNDDERLALLLAGDAGLRRAELWALPARDVDLEPDGAALGWIHAERTKSHPRDVPVLTARLRDALDAAAPCADGRLLHWSSPAGMDTALRALGVRAGLGSVVRLHALRHRWITRLRERGTATVLVQAWAGHRASATTDGYTHARLAPPAAAAEALRPDETSGERQGRGGTVVPMRRRKASGTKG